MAFGIIIKEVGKMNFLEALCENKTRSVRMIDGFSYLPGEMKKTLNEELFHYSALTREWELIEEIKKPHLILVKFVEEF